MAINEEYANITTPQVREIPDVEADLQELERRIGRLNEILGTLFSQLEYKSLSSPVPSEESKDTPGDGNVCGYSKSIRYLYRIVQSITINVEDVLARLKV